MNRRSFIQRALGALLAPFAAREALKEPHKGKNLPIQYVTPQEAGWSPEDIAWEESATAYEQQVHTSGYAQVPSIQTDQSDTHWTIWTADEVTDKARAAAYDIDWSPTA